MHEAITYGRIRYPYPLIDIPATSEFIRRVQKPNGEIPWSVGGKTDPWDHVESAMGLTIGGYHREAREAFLWSAGSQLQDGSWWAYYQDGKPMEEPYKDSNMTAYIAVGVLHYYLATGDYDFLQEMWDTVSKAMDYVIGLQGDDGEIFWAKRPDGSIDRNALLTGCSSIYLSLKCALKIASLLNEEKTQWAVAMTRLGRCIREKPHLFDDTKSRFSMDWYYPVLAGALQGNDAGKRIAELWNTFVVEDWGVLCVSDSPWVTVAETAELVISLAAMEELKAAEMVFGWIPEKRYDDGAFWTGVTVPAHVIYTEEKTAWTAAAVLLAADILYGITSAGQIFSHKFWTPYPFSVWESRSAFRYR
jgi:hypothetical protein